MPRGPEGYLTPENKAMWIALDSYFLNGDPSGIMSLSPAWRPAIFSHGPMWIADRLDKMGPGIEQMAQAGVSNSAITVFVLKEATHYIEEARKLASLAGQDTGIGLISYFMMATSAGDEDEATMVAITLNDELINTIQPLQKEVSKSLLTSAYKELIGTGCRYTTALVLKSLGDPKFINEFERQGYPDSSEMVPLAILDVLLKGTVIKDMLERQHKFKWTRSKLY